MEWWRIHLWEVPDRRLVACCSLVCGAIFILFWTLMLDEKGRMAAALLDRETHIFRYPMTIQNLEHMLFFITLGELYVRWRDAVRENGFFRHRLLPESDDAVLTQAELGPIRRKVASLYTFDHGFLPQLIDICILQFQSGRSVDQTVAVMNSNLELVQHRVDLKYSLIRYLAWALPTLGFIGTVLGMGSALGSVPTGKAIDLNALAKTLSLGFDATLVALVESAILVGLLHLVQEKEELALNKVGHYTLRNLINRLYVGEAGSR